MHLLIAFVVFAYMGGLSFMFLRWLDSLEVHWMGWITALLVLIPLSGWITYVVSETLYRHIAMEVLLHLPQ